MLTIKLSSSFSERANFSQCDHSTAGSHGEGSSWNRRPDANPAGLRPDHYLQRGWRLQTSAIDHVSWGDFADCIHVYQISP
jgi:hypothetical protein